MESTVVSKSSSLMLQSTQLADLRPSSLYKKKIKKKYFNI